MVVVHPPTIHWLAKDKLGAAAGTAEKSLRRLDFHVCPPVVGLIIFLGFRHHRMLRLSWLFQQLLALLFVIYNFQLVLAQQTVTITNAPAYSSLKVCGQGCFFNAYACVKDVIGWDLGCIACTGNVNSIYWAPESCYCRSDLQTAALSSLSTCIKSACTEGEYTVDLSSASSVYAGYCTAAGYVQAASTASAGGPYSTIPSFESMVDSISFNVSQPNKP